MAALDVREGVDEATLRRSPSSRKYKYGWDTEIETDYAPIGLNEDIVRLISSKNGEPEWMTEWRLGAFARWQKMEEPTWAMVHYPRSTFRRSITTPPQEHGGKPKSLVTSIRSCLRPTRSWGFR